MRRSEPFTVRSNDRLTCVGKTGSGKTAATKHLVWSELPDCIFYDVKGREYRDLKAPVLRRLDQVATALFPEDPDDHLTKFVFRPEQPSLDQFDKLCKMVYEHGNLHLIADELKTLYHGSSITENHNLMLTNGRDAGVGITHSSQRPMRIPREAISESEHILAFRLRDPDDKDRMEKVMGPLPADLTSLDRYHFVYDHEELDEPILCEPFDL